MRGLQTLEQKIKFGLHGVQLTLISVTAIVSVVTLVQTGSLAGHLWFILSLCFVSLPIVLYQLITPTWFSKSRYASRTAYVVTDIGLALLWCGNLLTLVVWEAQGECQTSKSALQHGTAQNSTMNTDESLAKHLSTTCPTTQSFLGRNIILCLLLAVTSFLNMKARRQHRGLEVESQPDVPHVPLAPIDTVPWMSGLAVKVIDPDLTDPSQPPNHFAGASSFEDPPSRPNLRPTVTSTPRLSVASELRSRKGLWSSLSSKRNSSSAPAPRAQSVSNPRPAGARTLKSLLTRQSSSAPPEDVSTSPSSSWEFRSNTHTVTPDGIHFGRLVEDWGPSSITVDTPIRQAPDGEVLTVQASPTGYVTPSALSPTPHNQLPDARTSFGGATRYYRQSSVVSNKQKKRE